MSMSAVERPVNDRLEVWSSIDSSLTANGLLLGNGASRVIWSEFKYDSLLERAKGLSPLDRISDTDQSLFDSFETTNFETVLSALSATDKVLDAIDKHDKEIMNRYRRIRSALVKAVHGIHVEHAKIPDTTLNTIGQELNRYDFVYSTNYDLILYWSMVNFGLSNFKDYFFCSGPCFNPSDTDVWGKVTKVLFIHGGLHLYIDDDGSSCKMTAGGGTLLSNFELEMTIPLFISEGDHKSKLSAIYRSDYLAFAYFCLAQHSGPLVIFGQALGESDKHLVDAIKRARITDLVIGVYPSSPDDIKNTKAHYRNCFPNCTLHFFDSRTHPIGAESLRVNP